MTCQVILELKANPAAIESLRKWLKEILPDTRAYDGCVNVEVVQDQSDATSLVIMEKWYSRQHYERYLQWRTETGILTKLETMTTGELEIRFLDFFGV
jgi:quinol monooxygenase YgiN